MLKKDVRSGNFLNELLLAAPENHSNFAMPRTWAKSELKFEGKKLVISLPKVG